MKYIMIDDGYNHTNTVERNNSNNNKTSAQRVPKPDPLPGISFDTRPDPIQF